MRRMTTPVIASVSEAIQKAAKKVWIASSQVLLAMTAVRMGVLDGMA
jgi:hypothetical protein